MNQCAVLCKAEMTRFTGLDTREARLLLVLDLPLITQLEIQQVKSQLYR